MVPTFSKKDLEELCLAGESAARKYVFSVVDRRLVRSLSVRVSSEPSPSGVDFSADVEIEVDPVVTIDLEKLAEEAADCALQEIDALVRRKSA